MPNRYDSDSDIDEETYLKLKKIKKKENKVKSLVTPVSSRKRVAESDGSDSDSSSSSSSDGEDPRGKSEHGQIDSDTESGTKSPRYDNFKTDRREGGRRRRERKSRSRERSRSRDQRKSNRERSIERRDRIERRKREYEREVEMRKSQREKRHKERQEAEEKEEDERRKKREERHREREEAASKRKETESKERDENVTDSTEKFHKRKRDETHETSSKENEDKADDPGDMEAYLKSKRTKVADEALTTRTGGAYIPPARLRMMQQQIKDKAGKEFQRLSWEALKKSINGLVNKVNVSNIIMIVRQLFQENIVRGRGLLSRSIIQAQTASPTFTHVYASLVAIINTKFPNIGELILKRCILNFKKGFRRNDKANCISSTRFIAHLVNQQVVNELLALQVLYLLLSNPTDDSVEVAVGFLKECGSKLTDVSPRGINAIFEELRRVLHENKIEQRTKYMVEVMFAVRKDGFKDHQSVIEELDLVEDEDQITHMIKLDDEFMSEDILNVFKFDPNFENNEEEYKKIKKEILDEGSSDESGDNSGADSSDSSSDEEGEVADGEIIDQTETNLVAFRRTVYLTIQSSLDFEECAHKIMKMEIKPGYEEELCSMILDCCAQQRTYEKFFGLLAQRFCSIDRKYIGPLQKIFRDQYETIHRLETNKLRNVAKFFAHLLHTDAISWEVLQSIKLNEDDTTSSSRIFIKIMIQELSEYLGLPKLNDRLKDVTLQPYFEGLFPRDNPRNTRFAINFFTSIGLGGLTDELRSHLKNMPKPAPKVVVESSSASSSSSSDSDSDSSSSSSSSNSSSDDDAKRKKKQTSREAKGKSTKIKNNKENSVENGVELDSLWYQRKELQKQKEKEQKQKRRDRDTYKSRDKESDSRYAMRELSIDDKSPPRNSKKHKKKDRHVPTSSDSDSSVEEEVNVRHSKYKEIETRVVRVSKKKDKKSRDHKEYDDEQHSGRGSGRDNAKYANDKSDRVKEKSSREGDGRSRNREYSRERTRHRDGSRERRR